MLEYWHNTCTLSIPLQWDLFEGRYGHCPMVKNAKYWYLSQKGNYSVSLYIGRPVAHSASLLKFYKLVRHTFWLFDTSMPNYRDIRRVVSRPLMSQCRPKIPELLITDHLTTCRSSGQCRRRHRYLSNGTYLRVDMGIVQWSKMRYTESVPKRQFIAPTVDWNGHTSFIWSPKIM